MLNLTFHYGDNKYIQKAHFYKNLRQARSQYQQAQAAETEAREIEGRIKRSLDLNCNYHKGTSIVHEIEAQFQKSDARQIDCQA